MRIMEIRTAEEKPKYTLYAKKLLDRMKEFYKDQANEAAFQEWLKNGRKAESA